MTRFHHVNLGVPVDGLDRESEWLVEVLDYRPLSPPEDFPQASWFEATDGSQVHLSRDEAHRPAAMAHVAVEIDDLEEVRRRIQERGEPFRLGEFAGLTVLNCEDPAGNRWELRQPAP